MAAEPDDAADIVGRIFFARAAGGDKGYFARRELPDGRTALVIAQLFNARLAVTRDKELTFSRDLERAGFDDVW